MGRSTLERLVKCAHAGLDLSEWLLILYPDPKKLRSKLAALKPALDTNNAVLRRNLVNGIV